MNYGDLLNAPLLYGQEGRIVAGIFKNSDDKIKDIAKSKFAEMMVAFPILAEIVTGLKENETVKIVLSDKAKKMIKEGKWSFAKVKDHGDLFRAIIKDKNGNIVEHAKLVMEDGVKSIDPVQLAFAMQAMAIQTQLKDISESLEILSDKLSSVIAGQQNDRIALFYSAEALYREAIISNNPIMKQQMIVEALSTLTNSIESLTQTTLYNVHKIVDNYDLKKNVFKKDKINEELFPDVKMSYMVIHNAYALKTAIYCNEQEYGSAMQTLKSYKSFLEQSLSNGNGDILYYADKKENSLEGFWQKRQNVLPEKIDDICNTYILGVDKFALTYMKGCE